LSRFQDFKTVVDGNRYHQHSDAVIIGGVDIAYWGYSSGSELGLGLGQDLPGFPFLAFSLFTIFSSTFVYG